MNRVGGGDGRATWTCDPHRLLEKEDCVVYSIGSDGTYEWEDGLVDLLGHTRCEIHIFDPGNYVRAGDAELKNIHYHQFEIKGSYNPANPKPFLESVHQIEPELLSMTLMEAIEHFGVGSNRTVDIVKFDCDDCEW
jgi:hypothetical protein